MFTLPTCPGFRPARPRWQKLHSCAVPIVFSCQAPCQASFRPWPLGLKSCYCCTQTLEVIELLQRSAPTPNDFALKSTPFLLCQVMANDGWGDSIKIPSILVSRCELNTLCWKYWFLSMLAKEYIPDSKQSQQMNSNTSPFSNPLTSCFWLYRFAPWQTWPVRFDGEKLIESSRQQTVMVSSWV